MQLTVLASSSKANGYLLHNQREALVIEAGVSLLQVKKALNFCLGIIKGCLVTHRHKDHAKYVKEYADSGINILGPEDIFASPHHRFRSIFPGKGYMIGGFKIIPFEVVHDVPCFGYLIDHTDTGRILFLTDTYLCECRFSDLNHIIIEASLSCQIRTHHMFNQKTISIMTHKKPQGAFYERAPNILTEKIAELSSVLMNY